jgi:sialidase-1
MIQRNDGSLLLVYGRWDGLDADYQGTDAGESDFGPAELWSKTSRDGGNTWAEDRVIVPNEGVLTTFETGLLRLPSGAILLSYGVKDSKRDCSVCFRKSLDDGRTWSNRCRYRISQEYSGYTGLTNGRLIRLTTGRILAPAYDLRVGDTAPVSFVLYSDDDGESWQKGADVDIRKLDPDAGFGACEPAVVELKDARVMLVVRNGLECIVKTYSADGGLTWSKPERIPQLPSPQSPANIKRIPQTGDLLLVWNNSKTERAPVAAAISKDDGMTWLHIRCIDRTGGCYPSITPAGNRVFVTYYGGDDNQFSSLKMASIDYRWLYQDEPKTK